MGTKPDGSSDRRKRGGSTLTEVTRKVRALERARDEGDKLPTGRSPRLETWLEEWLTASALRVRPSSLYGYTTDVRTHIVPIIGKHRLADLEPDHIEYLYTALLAKGLSVGTVHHVRTTLNKALNDAVRRRRWRHGCAGPARCDDRPAKCPERRDGGLVLAELKTRQSRRMLPLTPQLTDALRHHRQVQRMARIHAGSEWRESGLVFTTVTGRPIDPRDHSLHWTAFLEGAGVRPARLHDAPHTPATLLLVQGVDQRVVMDMLGWTSPTMTARYQHVVPELVEEANRRMSELLWGER